MKDLAAAFRGLRQLSSKAPLLCVTLENYAGMPIHAQGEDSFVKLSLTDAFGQGMGKHRVVASQIHSSSSEAPVIENQELQAVNDVLYQFTFLANAREEKDVYSMLFEISKPDDLRGEMEAIQVERVLKLLVTASILQPQLEVDASTEMVDARISRFTYPEKVSDVLSIAQGEHIRVTFKIVDEAQYPCHPHQVFIRFTNKATGQDAILVPRVEEEQYTAIASPSELSKALQYTGGRFGMDLILGDIYLANNMAWHMGDIDIATEDPPFAPEVLDQPVFHALPEISHTFEEPAPRTGAFLASIFTVLVLVPLAGFILVLIQLKAFQFPKFPKLASHPSDFAASIALQVGLGSMMAVFGAYWVGLNIFQAFWCLIPLVGFNVIVGHRALAFLVRVASGKDKCE